MPNFDAVLAELRQERDRLNAAIAAIEGVTTDGSRRPSKRISAAGRRRIAAAQKARWARLKGTKVAPKVVSISARKRTISPLARKRIAAAQKARWAAWRKKQKTA
jgi:hypothetical protein